MNGERVTRCGFCHECGGRVALRPGPGDRPGWCMECKTWPRYLSHGHDDGAATPCPFVLVGGTVYHENTPADLVKTLERARLNRWRVRLWYGCRDTGEIWGEENDVTGYIGRSGGRLPVPLLVYNSRSYGGGAVLVSAVVRIVRTSDHVTLYEAPGLRWPVYTIHPERGVLRWRWAVQEDGATVARFDTIDQAHRWRNFMTGRSMRK